MDLRFVALLVTACGGPIARHSPTPSPISRAALAEGEHTVEVGGVKLAYHVHGKGPICIVHAGGPGIQWSYLRMPAVEADLRLVYLEPVGTGGSDALHDPHAYTRARYAELLEGFRAALGLDKACVLGHSYGGFIAVHWAAAHPDHVGALILYDTAARSGGDPAAAAAAMARYAHEPWFAAADAAGARADSVTTDAEADAIVHTEVPLMFADWTHHDAAYARALDGVHAYAEPLRGASSTRSPWDLRAQLATVHAPTLVIVGAHDWLTSPASAAEIVSAIAGATLVTLPNSAHMGHIEEPVAFAAAIHDFVGKLK